MNIPISEDLSFADKETVINDNYVSEEVSKVINPIEDYNETRMSPSSDTISYELHFLDSSGTAYTQKYTDIGFSADDIRFYRNNFSKSYLLLNFYDSDNTATNNLVQQITLTPKVSRLVRTDSDVANDLKIIFTTVSPNDNDPSNRYLSSEGYHMFYYQEMVDYLPNDTNLYMEAVFNNAKDGKSYPLMTITNPATIDDVLGNVHTSYKLYRDVNGKYIYDIVGNNVTTLLGNPTTTTVKLYECNL